jgi:hypothetical protein
MVSSVRGYRTFKSSVITLPDSPLVADVVEKPIYQAAAIRLQGVFLGLQPQYEVARRVV